MSCSKWLDDLEIGFSHIITLRTWRGLIASIIVAYEGPSPPRALRPLVRNLCRLRVLVKGHHHDDPRVGPRLLIGRELLDAVLGPLGGENGGEGLPRHEQPVRPNPRLSHQEVPRRFGGQIACGSGSCRPVRFENQFGRKSLKGVRDTGNGAPCPSGTVLVLSAMSGTGATESQKRGTRPNMAESEEKLLEAPEG